MPWVAKDRKADPGPCRSFIKNMRINEPAVISAIVAGREAASDLYFLLPARFTLPELLEAARKLHTNLLVVLPSSFCIPKQLPVGVCVLDPVSVGFSQKDTCVFLCTAAFVREDVFADILARFRIGEVFVPFAELADPYAYGYQRGYRELGELRAAITWPFHLTAFLSVAPENESLLTGFYGSGKYAIAGVGETGPYPAVRLKNESEAKSFICRFLNKYHTGTGVVLCPTRMLARQLYEYAAMRSDAVLVHGGQTPEENAEAVSRFCSGQAGVMIATKHVLGSYLLVQADRVCFLGLPYDEGHYLRMRHLLSDPKALPLIVRFDSDEDLLAGISAALARQAQIDETKFVGERMRRLRSFFQKLEE